MNIADPSGSASNSTGAEPSHKVLLERARAIALRAGMRAAETEAARSLPAITMDELRRADLLRVLTPRRWGGLGRSFTEFCELTYELSQGCASTGWVYVVLAGHPATLIDYPEEVQEKLWGADPNSCVSSVLQPMGQAKPAPGGYRVSGRYPFASGSDHTQWTVVGAMVPGEGGALVPRCCLVPRSELSTIDDWHTLGLCGTGSKTLVAQDVFVPSSHVGKLFPFKMTAVVLALQPVMVGAARSGVSAFVRDAKAKTGKVGAASPGQSDRCRVAIGQSVGDVMAAWTLLSDALCRMEAATVAGTLASPELVARTRGVMATISRLAISSVERVFELSGGHGVYNNPLSRAYRDVKTGTQHPALNAGIAGNDAGTFYLA